eukprot:2364555-Rhodomonas_salina.1
MAPPEIKWHPPKSKTRDHSSVQLALGIMMLCRVTDFITDFAALQPTPAPSLSALSIAHIDRMKRLTEAACCPGPRQRTSHVACLHCARTHNLASERG